MSNKDGQPSAAPRRRSRFWLYAPYVLLLVLAAGLCIFWFVARDRVEAAVDDWLASEAKDGRQWTCPNRSVTGFPMRFEVNCERPTFAGVVDGRNVNGEMGGFKAVAQIYDPNLVGFNFTGPVTVREADGQLAVRTGWDGFSMSVRRTADAFSRMSLSMLKPVVDLVDAGGGESRLGQADAWEMHVRPAPGAAQADDMWDIATQLVNVSAPATDAFFGDRRPLSIEFQGVVNHVQMFRRGIGPAELDRWRDADGRLKVVLLKLTRGNQIVEARGQLGLDGLRRPSGRLDVQAAGVSALVQRLLGRSGSGLAGGLAGGLGSGLGGLLAGSAPGQQKASGAASGEEPQRPRLSRLPPLLFADGRLMVGPFPVLNLPPIN